MSQQPPNTPPSETPSTAPTRFCSSRRGVSTWGRRREVVIQVLFARRANRTIEVVSGDTGVATVDVSNVYLDALTNGTGFNVTVRGVFVSYTKLYFKTCLVQSSGLESNCTGHSYLVAVLRVPTPIQQSFPFLIAIIVAINYISMGCQIELMVIINSLKKPIPPLLGCACQFLFMPLDDEARCERRPRGSVTQTHAVALLALCAVVWADNKTLSGARRWGPAIVYQVYLERKLELQFRQGVTNCWLVSYGMGLLLMDSALMRFGIFLLGCSPGGNSSNLWTLIFNGDVTLSVTMTFISTIASIGTSPPSLLCYGAPSTHINIVTVTSHLIHLRFLEHDASVGVPPGPPHVVRDGRA
ncbi:hypothetical protein HPB48_017446 [Haemaphysalis longicornis]|uniref:Uncharacterized protein n=1 Tax=Haemaphysalis longicornis TaxID=44386 RepID=A0A9J6FUR9_HAELO|nr:hypothetical protein HPB48_017446 [Haemaphysalis longicornis]